MPNNQSAIGVMTDAEVKIENNFSYHTPKGDQPARYVNLREEGKRLAYLINEACPESREKALRRSCGPMPR